MVFNESFWLVVLSLWIVALTGFGVYRELQFKRFLRRIKEGDLRRLLENVLKDLEIAKSDARKVGQVISEVREKDLSHIQKVGLVRFNPFRDAGGNQSFALALLNDENSGIVLTGLHARETTRIYIKDVARGGSRSELSKEEKQAIDVAIGKGK